MRDVISEYCSLLKQFLGGEVSVMEFQASYLKRFAEEDWLDEALFQLLDELFGDVNSYTTDQELLTSRPDFYLDEASLRGRVEDLLIRLCALRKST